MTVVAYDAGPALASPTGVGVYVRDLGNALAGQLGERIRFIGARPDGPFAERASTHIRPALHQAWIQLRANGDVRAVRAELVHYTNAVAPLSSVRPFVLTVQDLSLLRYPHYHPGLRLAAVPVMVSAVYRAQRVIVPSTATATELHRLLRVPARRLHVVELAPAQSTTTGAGNPTTLTRWGLEPGGYVLSIGTLEPRKNLRRLIQAFEAFARDQPDVRLVLMGAKGWRTRSIDEAISQSSAADRIVATGYVTDDERHALLRGCGLFAYVSLYEGYGLPIVEAMAAGAAVVTSQVSSMPEAAGGAAILVDPRSVAAIASGMGDAWQDRERLGQAGRDRVARLSWDRTARETAAVYEEVLVRTV